MPSEVTTYTPTRGTRIHPEGLRLPFEGKDPGPRRQIKASFAGKMVDPFSRLFLFE
jgi:hypothetical protein